MLSPMASINNGALIVILATLTQGILMPNLTGHHSVGVVSFELRDTQVSPERDLMASVFYPTPSETCDQYPHPRALPGYGTNFTDTVMNLTNTSTASLFMQAHEGAPISQKDFPLLMFGPGYGNSRLWYNAIAEDLASNGYIIVTMDHPNDSDFIQYPNGSIALYTENDTQPNEAFAALADLRVSDIIFILNHISNLSFWGNHVPGATRKLNTSKVGALGHSLGGSVSASLINEDSRFVAGINLDGTIFGNISSIGLDQPFMQVSSSGHNSVGDPTWAEFWSNLRGWRRSLRVDPTKHTSYQDTLWFANVLRTEPDPASDPYLRGVRMFEIESAYIVAFFDEFLEGKNGSLLYSPSADFPEVTIVG